MTTADKKPMPWEARDDDLTVDQVREQLARILATGALQAALTQGPVHQVDAQGAGPEARHT